MRIITRAILQIPDILSLWVNGNPAQRAWLAVMAVLAALVSLLVAFPACFGMLCLHVIMQYRNPWDLSNLGSISKYCVCLCLLAAVAYAMWVASCCFLRSMLEGVIVFGRIVLTIVAVWIFYICISKPSGVGLIAYAESNYHATLLPWLVLLVNYSVLPVLSVMESMQTGPICCFLPETVACNVSNAMYQRLFEL